MKKRLKKNEYSLRELEDNMKRNNICITGISEGIGARDRKPL